MVDLHSHVLPKMDDGSASPEESAAMLRLSKTHGITLQVATPHFYAHRDNPEHFLARRAESHANIPYDPDTMPQLLLGAEVAYFGGMSNCDALVPLQIGNSGLILVEMPFASWNKRIVDDVLDLQQLGLRPVLAHVDRYTGKDQFFAYREALEEQGALFQCNADAFFPMFSKFTKLLKKGQIHFLGSDAHNLSSRAPQLDKAAKILTKKIGAQVLADMETFAHAILFAK